MMNSNYPHGIVNPIYLKQNDVCVEPNCQWEPNKNIANMVNKNGGNC